MTTRCWISGITGRVGELLKQDLSHHHDFRLSGGWGRKLFLIDATGVETSEDCSADDIAKLLHNRDAVFDFSSPKANRMLMRSIAASKAENLAILVATTGLTHEDLTQWRKLSQTHRVLIAPNTSLGVLLLRKVSKQLAASLSGYNYDVEMVEKHHRFKKDSPSGTALMLAEAIADASSPKLKVLQQPKGLRTPGTIGVHSVRGGQIPGEHTISFFGDMDEIEITHRALNRSLFSHGALVMMNWLKAQKAGLYQLDDVET